MLACLGIRKKPRSVPRSVSPLIPLDSLPATYTPNIQFDPAFFNHFKRDYETIYDLLCLGRRLEAIPLVQFLLAETEDEFPLEYAWLMVLRCFLDFDGGFLTLPPEVGTRRKDGIPPLASEIIKVAEYQYTAQDGPIVTGWNHWEWKGKETKIRPQARSCLNLLAKLTEQCPIPTPEQAKRIVLNDLVLLFHVMYLSHLVTQNFWTGLSPDDQKVLELRRENWSHHYCLFRQYVTRPGYQRLDLLQLLGNLVWSHMAPLQWNSLVHKKLAQKYMAEDGQSEIRTLARSQNEATVALLHKKYHQTVFTADGSVTLASSRAEYLELAETFARLENQSAELQSRFLAAMTTYNNPLTREQQLRELLMLRTKTSALGQPRLTLIICSAEVHKLFNNSTLRDNWGALLPILEAVDQAEKSRLGTLHVQKSSPTWIHQLMSKWMMQMKDHPPYDRVLLAMCAEHFAQKYHPPVEYEAQYLAPKILEAYLSAFYSPDLFRGDLTDSAALRMITQKAEAGLNVAEAAQLSSDAQVFWFATVFTRMKISEAMCENNSMFKGNYLHRAAEVGQKYFTIAKAKGSPGKAAMLELGTLLLHIENFDANALGSGYKPGQMYATVQALKRELEGRNDLGSELEIGRIHIRGLTRDERGRAVPRPATLRDRGERDLQARSFTTWTFRVREGLMIL